MKHNACEEFMPACQCLTRVALTHMQFWEEEVTDTISDPARWNNGKKLA